MTNVLLLCLLLLPVPLVFVAMLVWLTRRLYSVDLRRELTRQEAQSAMFAAYDGGKYQSKENNND